MTVQAKVRCISNAAPVYFQPGTDDTFRLVRFTPVYDPDPASPNYSWSEATPSGYIELGISNRAAFDDFEVGHEYLLTFEPEGN